jgi:outer membrane protein assembly factor BamB
MAQRTSRVRAVARGLLGLTALVGLVTGEVQPARAYIDIPVPSLAELCKDSHRGTASIAVLRVEKVNREKRGIVFSKVRDLKGSFPTSGKYFGDTFTHVIRESANDWLIFKPHNYMDAGRLELQNQAILAWAAEGKRAVIFQRDGEHAICVGHLWYTARPAVSGGRPGSDLPYKSNREKPPEKEQWVYGGASDPRFARFFCGDIDELIAAVADLRAGKTDVIVPRMVGTAKMVSDRTGPILRFRADREEFGDRGSFTPDARPKKEYHNPFGDLAPWSTHRDNAQRTGADDMPGPTKSRVLWAHSSNDHFIAPLVPGVTELYASSLGGFNTPGFHAFALDPVGENQLRWEKGVPLLKQPIAAAPAIVHGHTELLVFGDGFHTDEGASLRCIRAADGFPLWQLAVAGNLVHFEGTPTFADKRLYAGGGNAGVLCLDPARVTFDRKEQDLSLVQAELEKQWKDLLAKYELDKKKDPAFALPPDESMLPKSIPKLLWQKGQDKWHVDAPVAVVEDRVLAASAYLDDDKTGERALFCLKPDDGSILWKTPLKLNPWAGPTVGPYVLVGSSSIHMEPKAIPGATGEIVALELDTGKIKWQKGVPGGVLSTVTVREGFAIFTATDGKVRAWDAFTGEERWSYDAGAPFFAGAAVTSKTVYTADLKGVVHALNLADGKRLWTLELSTKPTSVEGQVYGSPTVHGGRLYVATCDLAASGRGHTGVVCIGER